MKPAGKFRRSPCHPERGITMVLVALAMVAIIAMAAMSIDLVTLYLAREEAQRSADAAALAAARVISISGITGTGDPHTQSAYWQAICGAGGGSTNAGLATQVAQAIGGQNDVGNLAGTVTVTYSTGVGGSANCATNTPFAVNPLVTVQVQRAALPTFFSRIWGVRTNSITATATAEAFNPSTSDQNTDGGPTGTVTPVQPRCVKPWIVPNLDPGNPPNKFVAAPGNGAIQNPGISLNGSSSAGVIGETFTLFADCGSTTSPCSLPATNPPTANVIAGLYNGNPPPTPPPPNLQYLAGLVSASSIAVPSCTPSGTGGNPDFAPAVAGCDQNTIYHCGVPVASLGTPNAIDLSENPGGSTGDTATAVQCLVSQSTQGSVSGQDLLDPDGYPFTITAGSSNLNAALRGSIISASNSIVSLPIYDGGSINTTGTTNVAIVGFLQVFINQVNTDGSLNVTVLNVAGCGNDADNAAVSGSSPVPVRLVTPP